MAVKSYVCNRYQYLKISPGIAFNGGLFETDDPGLQAVIETNEWYGVHIHPQKLPEEMEDADIPAAVDGHMGAPASSEDIQEAPEPVSTKPVTKKRKRVRRRTKKAQNRQVPFGSGLFQRKGIWYIRYKLDGRDVSRSLKTRDPAVAQERVKQSQYEHPQS